MTSAATSAPRERRVRGDAEKVVAEEGGEEVAEAAEVEVGRPEAAALEAGVTEAS